MGKVLALLVGGDRKLQTNFFECLFTFRIRVHNIDQVYGVLKFRSFAFCGIF